jgi:hypothetical protein
MALAAAQQAAASLYSLVGRIVSVCWRWGRRHGVQSMQRKGGGGSQHCPPACVTQQAFTQRKRSRWPTTARGQGQAQAAGRLHVSLPRSRDTYRSHPCGPMQLRHRFQSMRFASAGGLGQAWSLVPLPSGSAKAPAPAALAVLCPQNTLVVDSMSICQR